MSARLVSQCRRVLATLAFVVLQGPIAVAGPDVQGASDHPLVTRFPGSQLIGYAQRDWDSTSFPLSADVDTSDQHLKKSIEVEGRLTRLYYLSPVARTPLEVYRSYQQAFAKAGLKVVFSCESNCGQLFFHWRFGKLRNDTRWTRDSLHDATDPSRRWSIEDAIAEEGRGTYGTLTRGTTTAHVFFYTSIAGYAATNAAATVIEIVEPKAMQADQVRVDATAMAKGLAAEGKVVLGGIYFDTGKATLKPESDAQMKEMVALLQAQPGLQVFIVGHTDNQGGFDANLLLSKQRAEAVRDALVARFKADARRITPYGVASVSPVASNSTDAGRALNRRVELVAR